MAGMVEINILMNKAKPTMSVEFNQFVGTISNTNMNMRPLIIETYSSKELRTERTKYIGFFQYATLLLTFDIKYCTRAHETFS